MLLLEQGGFCCAGNLLKLQEIGTGCSQLSASICNGCAAVGAGYLSCFYRLQREIGSLACDSSRFRGNIKKVGSGGGT